MPSLSPSFLSIFLASLSLLFSCPLCGDIVVQNSYYALPGKEEEVYRWRLHASDVRAKLGLLRGRILRRIAVAENVEDSLMLPDVIWECEYPSNEARLNERKRLAESAEFNEVKRHMKTLLRSFQRGIFEVR